MSTDAAVRRAPTELLPPAPPAVRRLTPARAGGLAALALIALFPMPFGDFGFFVGQYVAVYAVVGLSVVVVTGYAGLISLMPYSFTGIGAITAGVAMASWGWPFWLAAPLAALAAVPVAAVVGAASVRLRGLYLAIATLTAADVLGETFFRWDAATGGDTGWVVTRPVLGPIDFSGDAQFYVLCVVAVGVLVWMVEGLRTSRLGRAMYAVRDNEVEAQALGINVYKTKLVALVIGGMLAGFGGAMLAGLLQTASPSAFWSPAVQITSILFVTLVAIGGIDRALGALFGALVIVVQQQIFGGAVFFFAFIGIYASVLLIVLLRFRPGGLVQIGRMQWELIRRRPALGTSLAVGAIAVNVGLAWLFVELS
ncbi:MAG: branched-chain amino acid ABC transporter permease [Actinomycetota bacterium]